MIFCRRCGTYSAKGTAICPKCQADLAAFGHESMSGAAVAPRATASEPQRSAAGATVTPNLSNYGGVGNRLLAIIVDGLLMAVAVMVPAFLIMSTVVGFNPNPQSVAQLGSALGVIGFLFLALMLLPLVYEVVMIAKRGATLGKKFRKLVVVRTNGEPVSMGRSILRVLIKTFLSGFFLIGYLMALFTAKGQALHDLIADTVVLRTE